jgi:hypothetical protein
MMGKYFNLCRPGGGGIKVARVAGFAGSITGHHNRVPLQHVRVCISWQFDDFNARQYCGNKALNLGSSNLDPPRCFM